MFVFASTVKKSHLQNCGNKFDPGRELYTMANFTKNCFKTGNDIKNRSLSKILKYCINKLSYRWYFIITAIFALQAFENPNLIFQFRIFQGKLLQLGKVALWYSVCCVKSTFDTFRLLHYHNRQTVRSIN